MVELESENRKMSHELEEFRTEAAHLRNQQATVRRLEERNRQLELQVSIVNVLSFCCSMHVPYYVNGSCLRCPWMVVVYSFGALSFN